MKKNESTKNCKSISLRKKLSDIVSVQEKQHSDKCLHTNLDFKIKAKTPQDKQDDNFCIIDKQETFEILLEGSHVNKFFNLDHFLQLLLF